MIQQDSARWQDKRRFPRLEKIMPLTLLNDSMRLMDFDSQLQDISRSGMSYASIQPSEPGQTVHFRLSIPGRGLVAGQAVIKWCRLDERGRRYLSGAEILSFSPGHKPKFYHFIGVREPLEFVDYILMAACGGVGLILMLMASQNNLFPNSGPLLDFAEKLPIPALICASVIGIGVLFKYH